MIGPLMPTGLAVSGPEELLPLPPLSLVLGGARSGKSAFAERLVLAAAQDSAPVYIATAQLWDAEMEQRAADHRQNRAGKGWETVETQGDPEALLWVLAETRDRPVLVDCLTLWLTGAMLGPEEHCDSSGVLHGFDEPGLIADLCASLAARSEGAPVVLVSNEVGLSLVPETPLGRRFRDAQGRINAALAAQAALVLFTVAGLPVPLKRPPTV
ncbi:MAG: bifunctional adenosylcobinamide kinase/adenosylcobinamide-phosphate guanylyltransferase [Rhodospirillaceae bacterium]